MRIKLKLTEGGKWFKADFPNGRRVRLCPEELHDFFHFPKRVKEIDVIITKRTAPEAYRIKTSMWGLDMLEEVTIEVPESGNKFNRPLTLDTDEFLISRGLGDATFYLRVEY